ncbi:hypothetical protein MXB_1752, partial [Myxobolus squamalis]
ILNKTKFKKEVKHSWTTIKSIEKTTQLDFLFCFDNSTNVEIHSILNTGQVNIDDEFDLRNIYHHMIFVIKIV